MNDHAPAEELVAPLIDCLRLIIQINRRLEEMRRIATYDAENSDDGDDSIVILAEAAQENLHDVQRDIMRIRIILETLSADFAPVVS